MSFLIFNDVCNISPTISHSDVWKRLEKIGCDLQRTDVLVQL